MKLMVCIANKRYGSYLVQHLSEKGYRVTKLASTGGFLKQGNDTLLIGITDETLPGLTGELKAAVDQFEKEKGWKSTHHRYTYFVVKGQDVRPFIQS